MVRFFNLIEDDDLVVELLSFLDFRAAVRTGQTCKRLKQASDAALDGWVVESLAKATKGLPAYGCSDFEGVLSLGWSAEFQTKVSLTEKAIEECNPGGEVSLQEEAEYNEDRARYLLRTRGSVDVNDFLNYCSEEVGWNVKMRFRENMPLGEVVGCMSNTFEELDGGDAVDDDSSTIDIGDFMKQYFPHNKILEEDKSNEGVVKSDPEEDDVFRLQHHALCLLRKADKSAIRHSHLKVKKRHIEYAAGSTQSVIMFQLPEYDSVKVEYLFSKEFQFS